MVLRWSAQVELNALNALQVLLWSPHHPPVLRNACCCQLQAFYSKSFTPEVEKTLNQCHMQHCGKCMLGKSCMMVLGFGYLPTAYSNDVIWKMYFVALMDVYIKCLASAIKEADVCTEINHLKGSQLSCMYKQKKNLCLLCKGNGH